MGSGHGRAPGRRYAVGGTMSGDEDDAPGARIARARRRRGLSPATEANSSTPWNGGQWTSPPNSARTSPPCSSAKAHATSSQASPTDPADHAGPGPAALNLSAPTTATCPRTPWPRRWIAGPGPRRDGISGVNDTPVTRQSGSPTRMTPQCLLTGRPRRARGWPQASTAVTPGRLLNRALASLLTTVLPVSAACAAMIRSCAPRGAPDLRTWATSRPCSAAVAVV